MGRTEIDCCKPDCPLRHPACWGSCPDYAKQRAELDENKQAIANAELLDRAIGATQYHSYIKAKKAENKRRKQGRSRKYGG